MFVRQELLQTQHFGTILWKAYIRRLLLVMKEDYPNRKAQFCEWSQGNVQEDTEFVSKNVWSDKILIAFALP